MGFTPIDIENQKFDIRMRGFDRDQVTSFLAALSEEAARLAGDRTAFEEERKDLHHQLDDYRRREKTIGETLCALRELSEKMKDDAKKEADLIIREARVRADKLLEGARVEITRLEGQISEIRVERDTFEDRLRLLIDEHQRLMIRRRQDGEWGDPVRVERKRLVGAEQ